MPSSLDIATGGLLDIDNGSVALDIGSNGFLDALILRLPGFATSSIDPVWLITQVIEMATATALIETDNAESSLELKGDTAILSIDKDSAVASIGVSGTATSSITKG